MLLSGGNRCVVGAKLYIANTCFKWPVVNHINLGGLIFMPEISNGPNHAKLLSKALKVLPNTVWWLELWLTIAFSTAQRSSIFVSSF